ncbi:metalloregulator ArsR/SmtB family transcription factor [Acuticoccus sp. M5D2P5]|uniref:ArsR/SmtB family transcription factor n=1 Tax=Acuticoccus kalidii TaxID=2910977 RepID=UPI001F26A91C|nr:metalloregulator ArsR/SmtB family transcription factor [Acuticoccus kalidii]MCF3935909.1 metalloregulator ArsR/SmtB family transcription factor [Acuticoccus kalidii]
MSQPDWHAALLNRAPAFAALGDPTRLAIVATLSGGDVRSITALADDTRLTRQGVTKHLRVLERAGLVKSRREGRETLFELEHEAIDDLGDQLAAVSRQWDGTLARLKAFAEGTT